MQNVHYSKQSRGKTLNCTYTYFTMVKVFGSKISETYNWFYFLLFALKCTIIPISIVVLKIIFTFLILLLKTWLSVLLDFIFSSSFLMWHSKASKYLVVLCMKSIFVPSLKIKYLFGRECVQVTGKTVIICK